MAARKTNTRRTQEGTAVALAEKGIHTGAQFASVMSALLTDTIAGRIEPQVANAVCNISGKLLKVVELQYKYGRAVEGQTERMLALTPLAPKPEDANATQQ